MLSREAIQEITDLGRRSAATVVKAADGREFIVTPENSNVEQVASVNPALPDHVRQQVSFDTSESFADYVNTFKGANTRLFVSVAQTKMVAEIDYHPAAGTPAQRGHRAAWPMPVSEEWKRWTGIDGQPLPQARFAEFLEENLADVVEPTGAALLEVATYLQAKKKVEFKSGVRLANGDVQLTYDETTEAGGRGQVNVPTEITLGLPVFFGGERYKAKAFLRWRITDDGKLTFIVALHRRQMILQDAVQAAAKIVGAAVGLPPLFGMPA